MASKRTTKSRAATPKRRDPPALMRDEVLREAGYKCGNPTCRHILTLDLHHIEWVKDGGPTIATNLLALCPNCHALHTRGTIPVSAIRHWKGILVALNHAFSRESTDLLLYLGNAFEATELIWYSADGFLRFAGLIAADLVEIAEAKQIVGLWHAEYHGAGENFEQVWTNPPSTALRVRLSAKGRLLVDSWIKGDAAKFSETIGETIGEREETGDEDQSKPR